jgi:hypothetical protein
MLKKRSILLAFMAVFFACATESAPPTRPGVLTVNGIPETYLDGIILVNGANDAGDTFRYSPKVLQRVTGLSMTVELFSEAAMVQKVFDKTGEYVVTVALYKKDKHEISETKIFSRYFVNGCASVNWNGGIIGR